MRAGLLLLMSSALLVSGCAGGGVGPLGLGAVLGDRNLASAEPLFSEDEDRCLDSSSELLAAAYAPRAAGAERKTSDGRTARRRCDELFTAIQTVIPARTSAAAATGLSAAPYTEHQRNEVIDAMLASSNRKCGRYSAFLKNADGIANVSLSLGAIITGGLGAFVGGPATAKALSGSAAILSGSRAAVNEVYLTNQTIHVLSSAFEKARAKQRGVITNRQACSVSQYTLMRGIEDAFAYHNSCSLVKGLEETVLAVERSDNPGLDAMRKTFAEYAMLVKQANEVGQNVTPIPVAGAAMRPDLDRIVDLDKQLVAARAAVQTKDDALDTKKDAVAAAKKLTDAEADPVKKAPLAATQSTLEGEYAKLETEQREAVWKRDGLTRDLERAAQQLVSINAVSAASVSPEARVCPFDVRTGVTPPVVGGG